MRGTRFVPAVLRVAPTDTIVFVNRDLIPHTVTAEEGEFDSGNVAVGSGWRLVLMRSGVHDYLCEYHPTMTGRIVIR